MRNVALGVVAVTLSGAFALVEERGPIERASVLHEFSGEMPECSVYCRVAVQCFEGYPDPRAPNVASEYRAAVDQLNAVVLGTALSIGQSEGAFMSSAALMM